MVDGPGKCPVGRTEHVVGSATAVTVMATDRRVMAGQWVAESDS